MEVGHGKDRETAKCPLGISGEGVEEHLRISGCHDGIPARKGCLPPRPSVKTSFCVGPVMYLPSLAVLGHRQMGLSQQTELLRDFALGRAEPLEEVREQLLHGRDSVLCTKCRPLRASLLMPWSSQKRD